MAQIHFDITSDASNLIANTNKATKQMRDFASAMKDIVEDSGDAFSNPTKQVELLTQAIESNEKVIDDYRQKLEKLSEAQEKAALAGDVKAVNALGVEMDTLSKRMAETAKETNTLKKGLASITSDATNAGRSMNILENSTAGLNDIVRVLPGPLRSVAAGITNIVKAAKALIKTPVGIALAAVSAALAGISAWLKNSDEGLYLTTKLSDKLQTLSEKALGTSKRMKALESAARAGATSSVSAFLKIQTSWNDTKESGESLNQIFPKVKKELSELGISVNSVADAESILVKNASAVITSFIQKAKAAALYKQAEEEVANALDLENRTNKQNDRRQKRADNWRNFAKQAGSWLGKEENIGTWGPARAFNTWLADTVENYGNYRADVLEARIADAGTKVENLYEKAAETFEKGIDFDKEGQDILKGLNAYTDEDYKNFANKVQHYNELKEQLLRNAKVQAKAFSLDTKQAEIDALKDGYDKTKAQIDLNYEKELNDIEEWYEGLRDKKIEEAKKLWEANPANNGTAFTFNRDDKQWNATEQENQLRDKKVDAANAKHAQNTIDLEKKLMESRRSYLEEYGNAKERELAITEKYDRLIEQAERDKDDFEVKRLQKQKEQELFNLKLDTDGGLAKVFANIDTMTAGMIHSTVELAEKELKTLLETGSASAEQVKILSDRIEELRAAEVDMAFGGWGSSFTNVLKNGMRLDNIKANIADLELARSKVAENSKEYEELTRDIDKARNSVTRLTNDMMKEGAVVAVDKLGAALQKVGETMTELGNTSGEVVSKIGTSISSIAQGFASGGVVGGVIAGASAILTEVLNVIVETKKEAKEFEKQAQELALTFKLLESSINNVNFSNAFGTNDLAKAVKAAQNLVQLQKDYREYLNQYTYKDGERHDTLHGGFALQQRYGSDIFDSQGNILDYEKAKALAETWNDTLLQSLVKIYEQTQANKDAMQDFAASVINSGVDSIADQMLSNFLQTGSAIVDMTDNMDDFTKSVAKSYVKAALMKEAFTDARGDAIAAALASGTEEGAEEAIRIYGEALDAANTLAPQIEAFLRGVGVSDIVDSSSKSSTAGGFATMSQDTANELNGRFTALQIAGELIAQNSVKSFDSLLAMQDLMTSGNTMLMEIRNTHIREAGYLEDIARYTKTITGFSEKLDQIQENTSKL